MRCLSKNIALAVSALLLWACDANKGEVFTILGPEETGLDFTNTVVESDDLNILDYLYFYNGGGVAIGDINNDKLPDIFSRATRSKTSYT